MILPRYPLDLNGTNEVEGPDGWKAFASFIEDRFTFREEVELLGVNGGSGGKFKFKRVDRSSPGGMTVIGMYGRSERKENEVRYGLMRFYCFVKKDIGLFKPVNEITTIEQWLLGGVDGKRNIDSLCAALTVGDRNLLKAINDQIIEEGIKVPRLDLDHWKNIVEMIDENLVKFNTYLDKLFPKIEVKGD